jgi:hypothetical protein
MKYWIQLKAPAGNWYDSIGFHAPDLQFAIKWYRRYLRTHPDSRLVARVDVEVMNADLSTVS